MKPVLLGAQRPEKENMQSLNYSAFERRGCNIGDEMNWTMILQTGTSGSKSQKSELDIAKCLIIVEGYFKYLPAPSASLDEMPCFFETWHWDGRFPLQD